MMYGASAPATLPNIFTLPALDEALRRVKDLSGEDILGSLDQLSAILLDASRPQGHLPQRHEAETRAMSDE
jgi:hypothetical protein